MTTTATDLREQRATAWHTMKDLMETADAANRELTAEERKAYDTAEAEMDKLEPEIQRLENYANHKAKMERVDRGELAPEAYDEKGNVKADATAAYKSAFGQWMKHGSADMDHDAKTTLRAGFVNGEAIKNAGGVATGVAGGYTVPLEYRNAIIERMQFVSPVRAVAETFTTDSGANLPWPTVDDTANEGAILGENTQITEQDVVFGTAALDAYMYTSKLVRLSLQLLQDTGFDIEAWLKKALGNRIGRVQNRHFTVGTGTNQPDGLVTGATVGKLGANGQTNTITYEDLVDLTEALDPSYLGSTDGGTNTNLKWMLAQSMRKSIRKLKDGQNRPLWEPSIQVGTPDTLLGYGIVLNNNMPAPAAGAKSLLFGDYNEAYVVRDVKDFFLVRFAERYADYLQVGFAGFSRADGTVQNQYAYTAYQHSAT